MGEKVAIVGIALLSVLFCIGIAGAVAPGSPSLDYPKNFSKLQDLNVFLIVKVSDGDDDLMNITFHNATDNETIGWNVVNGSGKAACVWRDLEYGKSYDWYANASDATNTTQSNTFNFSLAAATPSDIWEDEYIDPEEGLGWGSIENTTQILEMTIKPFLTAMGSWFYAIFVFSMVGLIYVKVQRVFIPSVILLLSGITMVTLLPGEIFGAAVAMIALGFTGIIYVAFTKRL